MNETETIPPALRMRLDTALTPRAQALLAERSRLDLALWRHVLAARAPDTDADALRATVLQRATARAALLLAGVGAQPPG
jgi:hypothetical protein